MNPNAPLSDVARLLGAPTADLLLAEMQDVRELCLARAREYLVEIDTEPLLDPITLQERLHNVVLRELASLGRVDSS